MRNTKHSKRKTYILMQVKDKYFSNENISYLWTILYHDDDFDTLCIKTNIDLLNGKKFEETVLYEIFLHLLKNVEHIVLWYASDFLDLDVIKEKSNFLKLLEKSISEVTCEM